MKILGANVIPATHGLKTLKEAVDSAFESYVPQADTAIYCIGSVVDPHPFPMMGRDFKALLELKQKNNSRRSRDHFLIMLLLVLVVVLMLWAYLLASLRTKK